ncbi:MAG: NAD(P)-dependent oxidoreductase [Acidimicrobiales bacterium]
MHVLFADALASGAVDRLRSGGHDVTVAPEHDADSLVGVLDDVDALVVRSTRVTSAALESSARLALVVRAGAGTENIDTATASARGVHVCNVPGRNAVAVAELTMGLLLAIDRHIADGAADLRAGRWNKKRYADADGLLGSTIAIVGLGDIGLRVAERAKAFGMRVVGQRREGRSDAVEASIRQIGIRLFDSLADVLGAADIVSIHVPFTDDTRGMVDAAFLSHLRDGAILLNTSRGDIVDEAALIDALDTRGIRAGLDVYAGEPASGQGAFASALASHPSVVGTHHIGASTRQAQTSVADGVVEVIEAFVAGNPLHCINLAPHGVGAHSIAVRHLDRVGVLAGVLGVLRRNGLNVEHMENRVFEGLVAAVATIEVAGTVPDGLVGQLAAVDGVLGVTLVEAAARP